MFDAKISQKQARANSRRFEDHRQTATRMRAAADEINPVEILEAVVRPEMQHLVEAVREIERRPFMNFVLTIPIGRRDHALVADALFDINESCLAYLFQH